MKRITKKLVKDVIGIDFDEEGLITLSIDEINEIVKKYLEV